MNSKEYIYLECISENKRLRIRIISNGYLKTANCRFPKKIRINKKKYRVYKNDIKLLGPSNKGKYHYFIKTNNITMLNSNYIIKPSNIYKSDECVICLDNRCNRVLVPCGHALYCDNCVGKLKECSVCRTRIQGVFTFFQ